MLTISNIDVTDFKITKSSELDKFVKIMAKHGITDGYKLLPTSTKHIVKFQMNNTYSAFANAIRRVLTEEIETKSLNVLESNIQCDDEFILGMNDLLMKNLSLVPVYQTGDFIDSFDNYKTFLNVYNNTNDVIDVKVSDIECYSKKNKSTDSLLSKLVPDSNITLIRLRPGKFLKLTSIVLQSGKACDNYAKFSLLNNVKYAPLDIDPYDQFTKKGTKSIEVDCKQFALEFTTCGNISPHDTISKVVDVLSADLLDIKKKITIYSGVKLDTYYRGEACEVEISDDVYNYKFPGHYITVVCAIAMRCFKLDENILFCSATVERFDSVIGIIRIKHANPNKIVIAAIDACLEDLQILLKSFKK